MASDELHASCAESTRPNVRLMAMFTAFLVLTLASVTGVSVSQIELPSLRAQLI